MGVCACVRVSGCSAHCFAGVHQLSQCPVNLTVPISMSFEFDKVSFQDPHHNPFTSHGPTAPKLLLQTLASKFKNTNTTLVREPNSGRSVKKKNIKGNQKRLQVPRQSPRFAGPERLTKRVHTHTTTTTQTKATTNGGKKHERQTERWKRKEEK